MLLPTMCLARLSGNSAGRDPLTTATSANAFDPNLEADSVHSFSFGYQRELDRNTVVELRYALTAVSIFFGSGSNAPWPQDYRRISSSSILLPPLRGHFCWITVPAACYDGGVIEVRRRLSNGLRMTANYTFAKAQSNSFQSNSDNFANFTARDGGEDLSKGVAVFDIHHAFKLDATYDVPIGRGRALMGNANKWVNALVGGFTISPVIRWQSGSPIQVGNVQLVGMDVRDLQKAVKVRKESTAVFWLPDDIILNSRRALSIDPLSATGYSALGVPEGRFIAPAGFGDCQQYFSGQCGFANLVIYGPGFFKFDASMAKRINLGERRNLELRVTALDVLNRPNFRVGGWGADVVGAGCCGATFGQLVTGTAYQDISTTNDPGGRIVDLMIRFNW